MESKSKGAAGLAAQEESDGKCHSVATGDTGVWVSLEEGEVTDGCDVTKTVGSIHQGR